VERVSESIETLADDYFEALKRLSPTWAHMLGDLSHAGEFENVSRAAEDAQIALLRDFASRADAVDESSLDASGRITRGVLASDARARADHTESRLREISADPIFGDQTVLPVVLGMLRVPDAATAEATVDKFHAIGKFFADLGQRHREGVACGRTPAEFAVTGTIEQIEETLATPVADDPFLAAVPAPSAIDVDAWRGRLTEALESSVRPGLAAYRDVLRDVVLPAARPDDKCGLSWLDGGDEAYARALRYYTTTALSAQEIHDIGLEQVAALAEEYQRLAPAVVGTSDLAEIFEALRTDPALHFANGDEIVEASKVALARAERAMADWFEVLPKAPCGVESTIAGAKGYYFPPAIDGSRGGTFFVNVTDASAWGTFEVESFAFHEGVPGHHLQLTIASELQGVPEFRKHGENSAYAEGWGLYTERLADEMGLYSSDLDRIGMLSADSLRACRLVVDTGLHALGWSRQQAIDYMVANSPLTEPIVRAEIDRYVIHAGQATSYMIGRLEIQRMRREAEARQAEGFDIKVFHSAVLDSGSLPLDVLDAVVRTRLP
jgi:uncharacterized protein (DUF885 family)